MKFAFAFAGIPNEIFDSINKKSQTIAGNNTTAHFLKHGWHAESYRPHEATQLVTTFMPYRESEAHGDTGDTAFAVLYVRRGESDTIIKEGLFPFLFTVPVDWNLITHSKQSLRQSKNDLVNRLNLLSTDTRACLDALQKEFTEQRQRTPWLLPVRNFRSRHLADCLFELQDQLLEADRKLEVLSRLGNTFQHYHPLQKTQDGHKSDRRYFIDDSAMEFKPPGHELHGFHRPGEGHSDICAISARRRLGVPYHRAFHYDCSKGKGATKADLYSCHSQQAALVSSQKHINIATNDYTRPEAQK